MTFHSYSPVVPINYNGSMNYLFTSINYQFLTNVKNLSLQAPAHFQQKWLLIHWL